MRKLRAVLGVLGGLLLVGAGAYYYLVWKENVESLQIMSLVLAGRTKLTSNTMEGVAAVRRAAGASIVAAVLGVGLLGLSGFKAPWQVWEERQLSRPAEPAVVPSKDNPPSRPWAWILVGVLILLGGYWAYMRGLEGRAEASAQYNRGFAEGKAEGLKEGEAKASVRVQPGVNSNDPYQEALKRLREKWGLPDLNNSGN